MGKKIGEKLPIILVSERREILLRIKKTKIIISEGEAKELYEALGEILYTDFPRPILKGFIPYPSPMDTTD